MDSRHYSFTSENYIIFSGHMAHIAVPLQVSPLEEAVPLILWLVRHVVKMANQHQQVHQLQSLANVVTKEFIFINRKLANIFKFFL